jgi:hypothetical protein
MLKVLVGIPFCDLQNFWWRFEKSKMGKERLLTTIFKSITSEERETKLKCDVQIISEQVVQK